MAGRKKKGGRARPGPSAQMQQRTAGSTGSMPGTSAAASSKAQAAANQQDRYSTAVSTTPRDSANTAATSLEGASDALAELRIDYQGGARTAASKQQQGGKGTAMQARRGDAALVAGSMHNTAAHSPALDASKLVGDLNSSRDASSQMLLLQQVKTASSSSEHRSALLAAGVIPATLRIFESSSEPVQGRVVEVLIQLMQESVFNEDSAQVAHVIHQLLPMVRHSNQDLQCLALHCLAKLSQDSEALGRSIVAAGAIPAVTEALHRGRTESRLCAASLLLLLAKASGMGIDTALAGAIPVAVSVLQCGTAKHQLEAIRLMQQWATNRKEVCMLAVAQDPVPQLLPFLRSSHGPEVQQRTAALLASLVCEGGGAQAAVEAGAILPLVRLMRSRNQYTCFFAADALQGILTACSKTANMATAAAAAAAAGAIKPLVSMLAGSIRGQQWLADEAENLYAFSLGPLSSIVKRNPTSVALRSLSCLAAADTTHCSAIVEAGATLALGPALCSEDQETQNLAQQTLQCVLSDDSNRMALAAQIVSLLHSRQPEVDKVTAMLLIAKRPKDASFRSALWAAGALAAMVRLLATETEPILVLGAAAFIMELKSDDDAAAIVEAGVIPPLARLLQNRSEARARQIAATALHNLGAHRNTHDQLAEVIPQLLQAMQGDDDKVHLLIGRLLQLLVRGQNANVLHAYKSTRRQWEPLLRPSCSGVQRHAAGAIYCSVVCSDGYTCGSDETALIRSIRIIDPSQSMSEWNPMFEVEKQQC